MKIKSVFKINEWITYLGSEPLNRGLWMYSAGCIPLLHTQSKASDWMQRLEDVYVTLYVTKQHNVREMETEVEEKRQCNFFVKKRKRFCRLTPARGKKFCGEHISIEKEGNGAQGKTDQPNTGRIPCPYDSHHTVAVKQLAKHLKVCNSRPKEQPIYYQKGINAGLTEYDKDLEKLRLASFSLEEIQQIISKVESAYIDHVMNIEIEILHHDVLKAELDNPENGSSARKHLLQLDSLLGHMTRLDLLQPNTCFVEFGAGRGRLSQWIQQAMGDLERTSFLLIDRAAVRHKGDAFYQRDDGGPQYERISMDIENLVLGKVPTVCHHAGRSVVAYTKHLCGAATDLALRCLMETRSEKEENLHPSSDTQVNLIKSEGYDNLQNTECSTLETTSNNSSLCVPQSRRDDCNLLSEKVHSVVQSSLSQNTSQSKFSRHEEIPDGNSSVHQQVTETTDTTQSVELPLVSTSPVKGVVMALCCHHRCSWRTHVGKEFFKDVSISEKEFMALVRMSSWATCGTRPAKKEEKVGEEHDGKDGQKMERLSDEQDEHQIKEMLQKGSGSKEHEDRSKQGKETIEGENSDFPEEQESIVSSLGLSVPEREEIGFKCKRVLDMGRLVYLRNLGMDAKLVYYVERNISPENVVLIATPLNH